MPDSVGFYGDMTGRENLRYTARLNRMPADRRRRRIDEVLDQVGLTDRADDKTDTYSRGMLQRLGIADALVKDPDVLILDEPTTAIDPLGVVEVLDLLRRLVRERGMAILLSSHLLNQVQSVCDRIGIFAAGRLIGQGTMEQLAARFGDGRRELEVGLDLPEGADDSHAREVLRDVPGVESLDDGPRPGDPWTLTVAPGSDPAAGAVGGPRRGRRARACRWPPSARSSRRSRTSIGGRWPARRRAGAVRPRPSTEDTPAGDAPADLDRVPAAAAPPVDVAAPDPVEPVTLPSETPSTEEER